MEGGGDGRISREAHDLGLGRGQAEPLAGVRERDLVAGTDERVVGRDGTDHALGQLVPDGIEGEHEGIRGGDHDEPLGGIGASEVRDLPEKLVRLYGRGHHQLGKDARMLDDGNERLVDAYGSDTIRLMELAGVGIDRYVSAEDDGKQVLTRDDGPCGGRALLGRHRYPASLSEPRLAAMSRFAFSSDA